MASLTATATQQTALTGVQTRDNQSNYFLTCTGKTRKSALRGRCSAASTPGALNGNTVI